MTQSEYSPNLGDWLVLTIGELNTRAEWGAQTGATQADVATVAAYDDRCAGLLEGVAQRLAELAPADADVRDVATAIVDAVEMPVGKRPYRIHIDPADDGSAVVSAVADRIRQEFLIRIGLEDLLSPAVTQTA